MWILISFNEISIYMNVDLEVEVHSLRSLVFQCEICQKFTNLVISIKISTSSLRTLAPKHLCMNLTKSKNIFKSFLEKFRPFSLLCYCHAQEKVAIWRTTLYIW